MPGLEFDLPREEKTFIKVIGLGGGGGNAVEHMFREGIRGVDLIICNTDKQVLDRSSIPNKVQIGEKLTQGLGVGGDPEKGRQAALESMDKIEAAIGEETKMLFITTGLGGGTGSGSAPVVAQWAREKDILCVGIVTFPFAFEGIKRRKVAEQSLEELKKYVDSLIVIHNEKLVENFSNLPIPEAFKQADSVLTTATKGIAEIITVPGYVNVDFEDVRTIMKDSGAAIMGHAIAEGEDRALKAVSEAVNSPLLADNDLRGARNILMNVTYGKKALTLQELTQITDYIQEMVGSDVDFKLGQCLDEKLDGEISVTLIATALQSFKKEKEIKSTVHEKAEKPDNVQKQPGKKRTKIFEVTENNISEEKIDQPVQTTLPFDIYEPHIKKEHEEANVGRHTYDFSNPNELERIEKEPAYIRRNVQLEPQPKSDEAEISRFTLEDKDKPEIKENNAFIADNLD